MKVVIIEDEPLASERLSKFIRRYDSSILILGVLESIKESVRWVRENPPPDLIFSDIELLDGNAFRIFDYIEVSCPVIFATAYDRYLLQAFEKNGIAYLLKPIEYEKFAAAMRKYEQLKRNMIPIGSDLLEELKGTLAQPKYKERFVIKTQGGIRLLDACDVAFIQVQDGMPFACDENGGKYLLNESLNQLEEALDPRHFFRLNRSEIVNIRFIEQLEPYFKDRLTVKLKSINKTLISSISRTPELRRWIAG